jgi:NitT/TauT family transport system ATP-binding protein
MTVFMVTHDIHEAFKLGTRFSSSTSAGTTRTRQQRYGATITYDLPLS